MQPIRVLIADDHVVVRQGTHRILEQEPCLQVVGEAEDGLSAVAMACELKPDVAVLDIRLPDIGGIDAAERLRDVAPGTRVMILSAYDDDDLVAAAMEAGALGYLLKSASEEELIAGVKAVACGEPALSPAIFRKLVLLWGRRASGPGDSLTEREREVLGLVGRGLRNKEVAERLAVSVRTVDTHLKLIFAKLGVSTRAEAVAVATSRHLLSERNEPGEGR